MKYTIGETIAMLLMWLLIVTVAIISTMPAVILFAIYRILVG